jgi:hypothetical protein
VDSRAFDFWVGSWECTWPGGHGRNELTAELGGGALLERFTTDDLQGLSVSVWESTTGRWRQTWVDSNGTCLEFAGGVGDDGAIDLRTVREGVPYRMRWTDVERDAFVWHWERERDGGWDELWRIDYRRRELDA